MHSTPLIRPPIFGGDLRQYSDVRTAPGPYVMNGDFLRLKASSTDASATLTMNGRLLRVDGEIVNFTTSMVITGTGNQTAVVTPLTDGWLIGFIVFVAAGTITDGEVIASVDVVQASGSGLTPILNLGSGEITNTRSLGLDAHTYSTPAATPTAITIVTSALANPAPGVDATWTVPAGQTWEIQAVSGKLVTSAAVASRRVGTICNTGTSFFGYAYTDLTQVASVTRSYWFFRTADEFATLDFGNIQLPLAPVLLPAGYVFSILSENLDVADQWSSLVISYRVY